MTRPFLCKCGHDKDDHNEGVGVCGRYRVKDFRIALSKKSNLTFCQCRAYDPARTNKVTERTEGK